MNEKIDVREKCSLSSEHSTPGIVGETNGQYVKVAKVLGELPRRDHAGEDGRFWWSSGT
ncbi:MAG: hypothetical protein WKF80_10530 [Thermomicrobiales bacterium]